MTHIKKPSARLGASGEDYLEAVYLLTRSGRVARVTGLARRLGVSKPSVVAGLTALERRGLVRREHYGGTELTPAGLRAAEQVYRRHRVIECFLREILKVSPAVAAADACAVEHVLSPETMARLEQLVESRGRRSAKPAGKPAKKKGDHAR